MVSRYARTVARSLAALAFAAGLAAFGGSGQAAAATQFDVSGTVVSVQPPNIVLLTSDISGQSMPITVNVSYLKNLQVKPGDPISLTIISRPSDTYVALGVQGEGNFVNGQDFGVQEQFNTIKGSIEARVGNVPEDDEALAQKHLGNNLHGNKEKDKDNTDNNKP